MLSQSLCTLRDIGGFTRSLLGIGRCNDLLDRRARCDFEATSLYRRKLEGSRGDDDDNDG